LFHARTFIELLPNLVSEGGHGSLA
jgi:hypothetical protein